MKEDSIVVLFTCYNRKNKTINAIKKINSQYKNIQFLIIDDSSTDNTVEEIEKLKNINKKVIVTEGNKYYTASMRIGMNYLIKEEKNFDYLLIINDDVEFEKSFLKDMVRFSKDNNCIAIGATYDINKKLSYGGIKLKSHIIEKYDTCGPDFKGECDSFNGNCVLIPYKTFLEIGPMDKHYSHTFGDFDYGFMNRKNNNKMLMFNKYIGLCNRNSNKDTWKDNSLKIKDRLKKKHSPKGAPFKEVFYYSIKNFGLPFAVYITLKQYACIFLKK